MLLVHDRIEKPRLNGYRVPGELYLVGTLPKFQCCKLPFELSNNVVPKPGLVECPTSWKGTFCELDYCSDNNCPRSGKGTWQFAGMHWVPEKFYKSAAFFFQEARTLPIQIKIKRLHCGIKIGESWVLLAHRKSIVDYSMGMFGHVDTQTGEAETDIRYKSGIFTMFRVDAIEFVARPNFTHWFQHEAQAEELILMQKLQDAGITFVNVIHDEDLESDSLEDETEITRGYE